VTVPFVDIGGIVHHHCLNFVAGKPEPGLISAQKYGKVKLVNGIPLS
jgi:hypothetical protein